MDEGFREMRNGPQPGVGGTGAPRTIGMKRKQSGVEWSEKAVSGTKIWQT